MLFVAFRKAHHLDPRLKESIPFHGITLNLSGRLLILSFSMPRSPKWSFAFTLSESNFVFVSHFAMKVEAGLEKPLVRFVPSGDGSMRLYFVWKECCYLLK